MENENFEPEYPETIFDLIKQAKENNGVVVISESDTSIKIENALAVKKFIVEFFEYDLSAYWFTLPHFSSNTEKITEKERRVLRDFKTEVFVLGYDDSDEEIYNVQFNLYEFLKIKEEFQNIETLNLFESFFADCKQYAVNGYPKNKIQFLNEHNPARVEVADIKDEPELTEKIKSYLKDERMSDWFRGLALGLNKIGPYSWFYISTKGLINFEEDDELLQKRRLEREKEKGKSKEPETPEGYIRIDLDTGKEIEL